MKNPTSYLHKTWKAKTWSRRQDTLREEQYPPIADSNARATFSSSRRKLWRAKDTTMMKCPDRSEGCTVRWKECKIAFSMSIPREKSKPREMAAWTAMESITRRKRRRRRRWWPDQIPKPTGGGGDRRRWVGLGFRWGWEVGGDGCGWASLPWHWLFSHISPDGWASLVSFLFRSSKTIIN